MVLGSCRLPKSCLSKATLPGRVVMAKVHFTLCGRKRKSKEFPVGTESCHLELARGLLFVHVRAPSEWSLTPLSTHASPFSILAVL